MAGGFQRYRKSFKSVRNDFTVKYMIKNGEKKNKIKDLYSPFRWEEMPETADRIEGRIAVSDIILLCNGNYRSFI